MYTRVFIINPLGVPFSKTLEKLITYNPLGVPFSKTLEKLIAYFSLERIKYLKKDTSFY